MTADHHTADDRGREAGNHADAWVADSRAGIAWWNAYVAQHGLPLAPLWMRHVASEPQVAEGMRDVGSLVASPVVVVQASNLNEDATSAPEDG